MNLEKHWSEPLATSDKTTITIDGLSPNAPHSDIADIITEALEDILGPDQLCENTHDLFLL